MDSQNMEQYEHVVELPADVSPAERSLSGSRTCSGVPCGFSDSKMSSVDAKERSTSMRKLCIAVVLCIIFMSIEVVGGIKANSLAILTDAAHLLSDVAAFAISLLSLWAAGWEATPRQSYGFFRIEILGALLSIQMIWLLAGILVYQAITRLLYDAGEVQGFLMFLVSAVGLVVNIIMALLLGHEHGHAHGPGHSHCHDHGDEAQDHNDSHDHDHSGCYDNGHNHGVSVTIHHHHFHEADTSHEEHQHSHCSHDELNFTEPLLKPEGEDKSNDGMKKKQRNINLQGAYLHVLGDSIQSIGVMIGGAIIWYKPEWKIIDLICTLIFSAIVLCTTIQMLRNILEVLMESTPREIDSTRLEKGICEIEEVVAIHELHIWAITVGKILLACHVRIQSEADADMVLDKVIDYIMREFNISHVTIQIERY
ncbi:hypothetical protein Leryth_005605 [Lithospermum erythrorhizon]|nr:hypothetical protein Leryth_005605 [Lithospermum erythrorhizon]